MKNQLLLLSCPNQAVRPNEQAEISGLLLTVEYDAEPEVPS